MNRYRNTPAADIPYNALVLRLMLGAMWLSHAALKLVALAVPEFGAALVEQGMPTPMAWPVMLLELAGGALIILGFHGRVVSLALLPMIGGVLLAHAGSGWMDSPVGGWGYPAFLMVASVIHVLVGDGVGALYSGAVKKGVSMKATASAC